MNFKNILIIFSSLAVFSCSNGQTDLNFEQEVLYEVIPKIIDSQFENLQGTFMIQKATSDSTSVWIQETSVNAIVGIMDSVYGFDQSFYDKYVNLHFSDIGLEFISLNAGNDYKLDISKIETKEDYKYKYLSEVPGPKKRWKRSKDFYLLGLIGFSRIQFDQKKKHGIMDFKLTCGQQCGLTALVYLKNDGGDWEIDEIESIVME